MGEGFGKKTVGIIILVVMAISFWTGGEFAKWRRAKSGSEELIIQAEEPLPEPVVEEKEQIFVHIAGAVAAPGVYRLEEGERLAELIRMAVPLDDAALDEALNLAEKLRDGQKIYVPTKAELEKPVMVTENPSSPASQTSGYSSSLATDPMEKKININTASQKELESLPGIGEVKAKAIISYRSNVERFLIPEDIKKVSGIGEATFAKLCDLITCD